MGELTPKDMPSFLAEEKEKDCNCSDGNTTSSESQPQPDPNFFEASEDGTEDTDASQSAPSIDPVQESEDGEEAVTAKWHRKKKVRSLWSIAENRNAWLNITGTGWRKLSNSTFSGNLALNILGSHAKAGNRTVNVKEADNKQITEIYVW